MTLTDLRTKRQRAEDREIERTRSDLGLAREALIARPASKQQAERVRRLSKALNVLCRR